MSKFFQRFFFVKEAFHFRNKNINNKKTELIAATLVHGTIVFVHYKASAVYSDLPFRGGKMLIKNHITFQKTEMLPQNATFSMLI